MDPLTNPAYLFFAAVIAPLLISVIKQQGFSTQVNALIALVAYFVVGIVGAVVSGVTLDLNHVSEFITVASVLGIAAYNLIWSNLGVTKSEPLSFEQRLTEATSVVKD